MIAKSKKLNIKHRIYNANLKSGNKKTVEKNLLKSFKKLQKTSNKKHTKVLELAIKNLTPALKINSQKMKRRKKKGTQEIPTFIQNNFLRINLALKYISQSSKNRAESNSFYDKFNNEIIDSALFESASADKKTDIQKRVLTQKNIFFKYRWKK